MDYKHIGLTQTASESQALLLGPQQPALYANTQRHPTEKVGTQAFAIDAERRELQQMSVMYGSHMPMRAVIERNIMARAQRAGGRSNNFGLHSHMGRYEEIDFCDTLNDANEQPNYDRQLPHAKLQKIYGL